MWTFLVNFIIARWPTLLFGLLFMAYRFLTSKYDYFERIGVPFEKPKLIFGNFRRMMFQRESFHEFVKRMYDQFPNKAIFGMFQFRTPIFVVRDPELIKLVTIKHFDHFTNRRNVFDETVEPLLGRNLSALLDKEWHDMRTTLSPMFTGSKMRMMFGLVTDCAERMVKVLADKAKTSNPLVLDMKDMFARFTNDVIASTTFGVEVNSFEDRDNYFFRIGKNLSNFTLMTNIKLTIAVVAPKLFKAMKIAVFDKEDCKKFSDIIRQTMKLRSEEDVFRPDLIQLLLESKKGALSYVNEEKDQEFAATKESSVGARSVKRVWADDDYVAQCFIFFFAGYDVSSSLMCFAAQELAANPEIQERLLDEIDDVRNDLNGKPLTYEIVQKMKYLDMVISETLRKWTPANSIERLCNKALDIHADGKDIRINVNDVVFVPSYGIHHDPKYYPNPEIFDPERFNDENKVNINPSIYLPFGAGPRNCIGSRFALMETKAILFYVLSSFTFEISAKTQVPLRFARKNFQITAEKGFWIQFKPR